MRFPIGLTADLTLSLLARPKAAGTHPHLHHPHIPHPHILDLGESTPDAPLVPRIQGAGSRILWVAARERFAHPEIARFASGLLARRRHLFLEADPVLSRRRIHEFRPVPRFYLAYRFDGFEAAHDRRSGARGGYAETLAAIRGVKLSGFLVCAHIVVHADTSPEELVALRGQLARLDADGYVITPGAREPGIEEQVQKARRALLGRRWALFSELLGSPGLPKAVRAPAGPALEAPLPVPEAGYGQGAGA